MERTTRAFSKEGAVEMDVVAAALQPRFVVAAGPEQTVSRTWLDTFDWRLHSAGISLEYVEGGPLILQLPDGSRLQAPLAMTTVRQANSPPLVVTRYPSPTARTDVTLVPVRTGARQVAAKRSMNWATSPTDM